MADRLTLAHAIEDAGIERSKAEALAGAILEAIHDNVATNVDIRELRGETKELRSELKADIQELRSEMSLLRANMALLEHRLLTRLGGPIVALLGLLFAALHLWPSGHG